MGRLGDVRRRRGASGGEPASLVREAMERIERDQRLLGEPQMRRLPEVQAILNARDEIRRGCIHELVAVAAVGEDLSSYRARAILSMATRKKLVLTAADTESILNVVAETAAAGGGGPWLAAQILKAALKRVEATADAWSDDERSELLPLIETVAAALEDESLGGRLRQLAATGRALHLDLITSNDDFGPRVKDVLQRSAEADETLRSVLDLLAGLPASGRPSKKWIAAADELVGELQDPVELVDGMIDALLEAGDIEVAHTWNNESYTTAHFFHHQSKNEELAVAAVKFAARLSGPALLPKLRKLAAKSVTVIGGAYGNPRSLKLANAAALAIADIAAPGSVTELLALERSVRHGTLLKQIRQAIDTLAAAQGVTRDELLERAVESHDLQSDGTREVMLSRGRARIEVDARGAKLSYVDVGSARRSFPAAVKDADADTLASLRAELKNIRKTIAGERHRFDKLMALDRRWDFAEWQELYLGHPVTGRLTRELVWGFRASEGPGLLAIPVDTTSGTTSAGALVELPMDTEVRLWHPTQSPAEEVRVWRQHLLDHERPQPIKQAFRETYVLTPAESQTREYSNRFAAHVFRQVQARALMKGRGWSPVALAWWDDGIEHGVARRTFESFGIRAEFFYDPIIDIEPQGGDLYPCCTSDQVRFFDAASDDPLALADVPLLVFSEAMRDVDLFIGVTSIGADPQWLDQGDGRRFETYWNTFSFGDLTAAAEVRREVVAQLLPKLSIADQCDLEERYLVVRGELRTYRIHLGSGNILMSPNDQYLCIVAARDGRAGKLFLPFDDDPVLSLILSKAFMLSEDTKIEDRTIVAQIKGS